MSRRLFVLLFAVVPVLATGPSVHAGPVSGGVKRSGVVRYYFAPGQAGTGIPLMGAELDAPGDVGLLQSRAADEPHVALANVWTTVFLELPIAFESEPFGKATMVGGTAQITAYLAEPTALAVMGFVEARFIDIAPNGTAGEFAILTLDDDVPYQAGPVAPARSTYAFGVPTVWQIPKGHRLRVELDFTCFCSTTMRFYYGSQNYAGHLTLDRYVRK
jgi:hypothetical protein